MSRTRRLYVPLDVSFFDDSKIIQAGERAGWLYLAILAHIKRREEDGEIDRYQLSRLNISGWEKRIKTLVELGLLLEQPGGRYLIPTWSKWNELSHDRRDRLAKDAARKREESTRNPDGIRADSERIPALSKKEGKKERTIGQPPPIGTVLADLDSKTGH